MKIALIGYGRMGKAIEQIALERGHCIVSTIDVDNISEFSSEKFRTADVAIEFTTPATAFDNYLKCFEAGVPVVSGTTGWTSQMGEIKRRCENGDGTFFYASNFSIGVNLFFALNEYLAKLMGNFPEYEVEVKETHHIHKLDAPSGTAITLAEGLIERLGRKRDWQLVEGGNKVSADKIPITAIREGEIPGIHEVKYVSDVDSITIRHDAKSRIGFALGAVLAAEFTAKRKGFLGMGDLLADIIK